MYAHHHYFTAEKVALVYPGDLATVSENLIDIFDQTKNSTLQCALIFLTVGKEVKRWQEDISIRFIEGISE